MLKVADNSIQVFQFYAIKFFAYSVDFSLHFLKLSFAEVIFHVLVYTAETLLSLF